MKKKLYYICISVWALLSACTAEQADETSGKKNGSPINIHISTRANADTGTPFEEGQKIAIYNALYPNEVADARERIGIYECPANPTTSSDWINKPNEAAYGLWKEDMKPYQSNEFYFTGITYSDGQELCSNGEHTVESEQTKLENIYKSDLLVARAVYDNWNKTEISLLFRHVLSRLDIELFLPIGNESDGLFSKNVAKEKVTTTLLGALLNYQVDYSQKLGNNGLAEVSIPLTPQHENISMYIKGSGTETTMPDGDKPAVKFLCQAILSPDQSYSAGKKCLEIKIGNKNYSYTPVDNTIFRFAREKITTVYLVLYAKKGSQQVELAGVEVKDWKTNTTNAGDLIED